MATGTVNTKEIGNDGGPVTLLKQSAAKAWSNLNGVSFGLSGSFNLSGAIDNGIGDYTINFTNSLADANYSPSNSSNNPPPNGAADQSVACTRSISASLYQIYIARMGDGTASNHDRDIVTTSIHGDLA